MPRPFEVSLEYLRDHLDEMVNVTFADLQSQFLILPKGRNLVEYQDFQAAYEALKRHTSGFASLTQSAVWSALREDSRCFLVLRTILGMSPPEWADLARSERGLDVPQNAARNLDSQCRANRGYVARLARPRNSTTLDRVDALISVALEYLVEGTSAGAEDAVHRLDKVDTAEGSTSLQHVAAHHIPYAMLLYERYLGRPFATHRDSVSELVGEVMENAIEGRLTRAGISFRKARRAERVPGYEQAPDFFVPDEFSPAVLLEAKMASDDGTARDKVTRILYLTGMRDERARRGLARFEVVACIDGRGFGARREDMRRMLLETEGKVFTLATLDQLISHTRLRDFLPASASESGR